MNNYRVSNVRDIILLVFVISILVQLPLFVFPWFTFSREIMGYYSGLFSIHLFIVQYGYIFYHLWRISTGRTTGVGNKLVMETALILLVVAMRRVFFTWTAPMNISDTIGVSGSMHAAQPCFWVTVACMAISLLLYQAFIITEFAARKWKAA